jgi:hypothetical protein
VTLEDLTIGEIINTATASGDSPACASVDDEDTETVRVLYNPDISLDKYLKNNADEDGDDRVSIGDTLTIGFEVENTGNVPLNNPYLVDNNATDDPADNFQPFYVSGDTDNNDRLDVDETWHYEHTFIVTADHLYVYPEGDEPLSLRPQIFIENTAGVIADGLRDDQYTDVDRLRLAGGDGTGTPGYWKNHTELWIPGEYDWDHDGDPTNDTHMFIGDWNEDGIQNNGETWITLSLEQARALLSAEESQRAGGNLATLGRHLVAAWLNFSVAGNNFFCVEDTIQESIEWAIQFDGDGDGNPFEFGNDIRGRNRVIALQGWPDGGELLKDALEEYNQSGGGCAIDRDNTDGHGNQGGDVVFDFDVELAHINPLEIKPAPEVVEPPAESSGDFILEPIGDSGEVNAIDSPALLVFKTAANADEDGSGSVSVGDTLNVGVAVENTGDTSFSDVAVISDNATPDDASDDLTATYVSGDANGDFVLDPGESWIYEYSLEVTSVNFSLLTGDSWLESLNLTVDTTGFTLLPSGSLISKELA